LAKIFILGFKWPGPVASYIKFPLVGDEIVESHVVKLRRWICTFLNNWNTRQLNLILKIFESSNLD
jgi:hypothetical protein